MAQRLSLPAWLDRAAGQDFAHCGAFAASWVREATAIDPVPDLAGLSMREWAVLVKAHPDGLPGLMAQRAAAHGFEEDMRPAPGHAGAVPVPVSNGRARLVCGVCTPSRRWAVWGGAAGVIVLRTNAVRSWRIIRG